MKYDLEKVEIVFEIKNEDGKMEEIEESFKTATEALDFIKDTKKDLKEEGIELDDDKFDIYITMKENRIIHSASIEPLDYDDAHIDVDQLARMAEEEPTLSKRQKVSTRRKL